MTSWNSRLAWSVWRRRMRITHCLIRRISPIDTAPSRAIWQTKFDETVENWTKKFFERKQVIRFCVCRQSQLVYRSSQTSSNHLVNSFMRNCSQKEIALSKSFLIIETQCRFQSFRGIHSKGSFPFSEDQTCGEFEFGDSEEAFT